LEIVAPDLPGYGLTELPPGEVPTYDMWAECAAALVEELHAERGLDVYVFGLSLGGLLAYGVATRSARVRGVIATTLADTRAPEVMAAVSRFPVLAKFDSTVLEVLPRFLWGVRLPIRWLSPMRRITNDPALSEVFVRDPLAGGARVPLGFLRSLSRFDVVTEPEAFTQCPVLCVHPAQDPWTPAALSRPFFDRLAAPKTWVDLEGCGHFPIEEPGITRLFESIDAFVGQGTRHSHLRPMEGSIM